MIWLSSVIVAPRRTTKQSLIAATFFALEVAVAAALISVAYTLAEKPGVTWAIVSVILVLYPGITQSLSAALLRIAANLLGSVVGFAVGSVLGTHTADIVLALVVVIFVGELLRMDLALRTACVASVIVMSANEGRLTLSVLERLAAVAVGCAVALAVQMSARPLRRFLPFVASVEATSGVPPAQVTRTAAGAD